MLWCLMLIVLVAVDATVLWWWLRREYRPVIFNMWAPTIYSAVLLLDFIVVWVLTSVLMPDQSQGPAWLVVLGIIWTIVIGLLTLFFYWVLHQDMEQ